MQATIRTGVDAVMYGYPGVCSPSAVILGLAKEGVSWFWGKGKSHKAVHEMLRLVDWEKVFAPPCGSEASKPALSARKRKRANNVGQWLRLSSKEKAEATILMQEITRDLHLVLAHVSRCQKTSTRMDVVASQVVAIKKAADDMIVEMRDVFRTYDIFTPLLSFHAKIQDALKVLQALNEGSLPVCGRRTWSSLSWYAAEMMLFILFWVLKLIIFIMNSWSAKPKETADWLQRFRGWGLNRLPQKWEEISLLVLGGQFENTAFSRILEKAKWVKYWNLDNFLSQMYAYLVSKTMATAVFKSLTAVVNGIKVGSGGNQSVFSVGMAIIMAALLGVKNAGVVQTYMPMLTPGRLSVIWSLIRSTFVSQVKRYTGIPATPGRFNVNAKEPLNKILASCQDLSKYLSVKKNNNRNNTTNNNTRSSSGTSYYTANNGTGRNGGNRGNAGKKANNRNTATSKLRNNRAKSNNNVNKRPVKRRRIIVDN